MPIDSSVSFEGERKLKLTSIPIKPGRSAPVLLCESLSFILVLRDHSSLTPLVKGVLERTLKFHCLQCCLQ
jgi:hypothetical protein